MIIQTVDNLNNSKLNCQYKPDNFFVVLLKKIHKSAKEKRWAWCSAEPSEPHQDQKKLSSSYCGFNVSETLCLVLVWNRVTHPLQSGWRVFCFLCRWWSVQGKHQSLQQREHEWWVTRFSDWGEISSAGRPPDPLRWKRRRSQSCRHHATRRPGRRVSDLGPQGQRWHSHQSSLSGVELPLLQSKQLNNENRRKKVELLQTEQFFVFSPQSHMMKSGNVSFKNSSLCVSVNFSFSFSLLNTFLHLLESHWEN